MKNPSLPIQKKIILYFLSLLSIFIFPQNINAQSPFIEDFRDLISNKRLETLAAHDISFTLPLNADTVVSSDYIRIDFPAYTNITVPTSISGTYFGTPNYSISGTTVVIDGITIAPGAKIFIHGIEAVNPISIFDYWVHLKITEDVGGTIVKNQATVWPELWSGRVVVSASVGFPTAEIQISGYGSPYAYMIFNEDSNILGTSIIALNGSYTKLFTGIPPGNHSFSFYGVDTENRNTSTISVDIPTQAYQRTQVLNQLLSPTIQVDDVSVEVGEAIYATGSASPNSSVTLFTDSPLRSYSTTASASGEWTYTITNTSSYSPGDYRIYSIAQQSSLQSLFSPAILFTINSQTSGGTGGTACGDISEGDLNCDSSINLIDFSILMYYWGTDSEAADIDSSGLVGLVDLSVMMYFWGT